MKGMNLRTIALFCTLAGLAFVTLHCSEAPLIERKANRVVVVELFSSTG